MCSIGVSAWWKCDGGGKWMCLCGRWEGVWWAGEWDIMDAKLVVRI